MWCIFFWSTCCHLVWNSLLPFSPEVSTEVGSTGGIGDGLGSQVVSSSQLLSWGVVRGHSTIGVGNQGGSWDWEADSRNSVAQPRLSLSRNGGNQAGQSSSKSLHCRWYDCCCLPKS